jgi:hypothetical protein
MLYKPENWRVVESMETHRYNLRSSDFASGIYDPHPHYLPSQIFLSKVFKIILNRFSAW